MQERLLLAVLANETQVNIQDLDFGRVDRKPMAQARTMSQESSRPPQEMPKCDEIDLTQFPAMVQRSPAPEYGSGIRLPCFQWDFF